MKKKTRHTQKSTGMRGTRMEKFSIQTPLEIKIRADVEAKKRNMSRAKIFVDEFNAMFPPPPEAA